MSFPIQKSPPWKDIYLRLIPSIIPYLQGEALPVYQWGYINGRT